MTSDKNVTQRPIPGPSYVRFSDASEIVSTGELRRKAAATLGLMNADIESLRQMIAAAQPVIRNSANERLELQRCRLPSLEECLDQFWREQRQPQDMRDVGAIQPLSRSEF